MITNTTSDLEEHLQEIDNKLQNLFLQDARLCDEDVVRSEQIQEERDSTAQCLRICAEVSKHMDEVQPKAFEGTRTASAARQAAMASLQDYLSASRMTGNTLKECKERLANTISELEKHDQDLSKRLNNHPREAIMPGEQAAEQERIQEEKNSIEQCLSICTKAAEQADQVRINIVEDLTVAQDSHQVVVATLGDLISAKRISAGPRSTQWMGQMSDETLQQLSRDRVHITAEKDMNPPSETTEEFEGRHGAGYKVGRVKKGN
jgi:chromosome segregation ATPase